MRDNQKDMEISNIALLILKVMKKHGKLQPNRHGFFRELTKVLMDNDKELFEYWKSIIKQTNENNLTEVRSSIITTNQKIMVTGCDCNGKDFKIK